MKSRSDLVKELGRNYKVKDRLVFEVGTLYIENYNSKDTSSIALLNDKIELVKKMNERIAELERDFIATNH